MPQAPQQPKPNSRDSWTSAPIPCGGGLILNVDPITLGTKAPGAALTLQNFECSITGGYRRINGYTKFDSAAVPGDANNPVLGLAVALGGVFAVRKTGTDNRIYFSTGSGWGSKLNTVARTGGVSKTRNVISVIGGTQAVIFADGQNYAWKWDGSTETLLNGTGAPTNPKYCEVFFNRLVLAGYGTGNKITFAAPNSDTDFTAAAGAIEVNVGDIIVGIKTFRDELVIFCQRFLKKVIGDGTTANPFTVVDIADSVGCISGDTIQEIGGDLTYLAQDTLRSYAATVRINDAELSSVCQSIQPLLTNILANDFTADQYSTVCLHRKSQYRLFINDPNNNAAGTIGLIGRLKDVQTSYFNARNNYEWSTMLGIKPYCTAHDYTQNLEIIVIGDTANGYVYRLDSGNDFDGIPMLAVYRSPDLTFDDMTLRKVFHRLTILSQLEGNFTSTLNLILDRGDINVIQPASTILSASGSVSIYGSAVYDTAVYSQFITPVFRPTLIGSGFLGAFQFSSTDSNAPYTINAYQVEFSEKGRR